MEENSLDDLLGSDQQIPTNNSLHSSISPVVESESQTSTARKGSSKGLVEELGGDEGVVSPIGSNGSTMSTTIDFVGLGGAQQAGNFMFPNIQPYSSSSMLPYARGGLSHHEHFLRNYLAGFARFAGPASRPSLSFPLAPIKPPFNPSAFWPPPPSLRDFQNFAHAWEGSLAGKVHGKCKFAHKAQAIRRLTLPPMLTMGWPKKLEIVHYIPFKALNYTMKIRGCGPIDYVFFHILECDNLDLSDHLMNNNLCAKIDLPINQPPQILIISPTKSKHHCICSVFPGDTIFVEPA